MNSALLVDESIRSNIPEVDEYISLLESVVVAYTADNATRMVAEANRVIGILADDLSLIAEDGSVKGTKLIKSEKNNMIMDRIVLLLKQVSVASDISRKSVEVGKKIAKDKIGGEIKLLDDSVILAEEPSKIEKDRQELIDENDKELIDSDVPAIERILEQERTKRSK